MSETSTELHMNKELRDFGYSELVRPHCIEVVVTPTEVLFIENPHSKHRVGEEPFVEKARLRLSSWKKIASKLAAELNRRIASDIDLKSCPKARWKEGLNHVDLGLGREMLVLVWAVEQLEDEPESIERVLAEWSQLSPEDRFFFYRLTNAFTGRAEDRDSFRRRGLAFILMGSEKDLIARAQLSRDFLEKKKTNPASKGISKATSHRTTKTGVSLQKSSSGKARSMPSSSVVRANSSASSTTRSLVSSSTRNYRAGKKTVKKSIHPKRSASASPVP
jgi:hypothetical protein